MKNNLKKIHGFSLVELLISVGIITTIMAIVLFNFSKFNERLALTAAAQEIALSIREAQVYGLSVKDAGGGNFGYPYGIYFSDAEPQIYRLFIDKDNDNRYDIGDDCGGVSTECIQKYDLRNGVAINDICNNTVSGGGCAVSYHRMTILFIRPNTSAVTKIYTTDAGAVGSSQRYGRIKLALLNSTGDSVSVTVADIGHIIIE